MTRFLLCSFALVLLYPSGIDMYLVGLPRIAQDPFNINKALEEMNDQC